MINWMDLYYSKMAFTKMEYWSIVGPSIKFHISCLLVRHSLSKNQQIFD